MQIEPYIDSRPKYLGSLDIARGIAALAVVLWHWQHFFFTGPFPGAFERLNQPFYTYLSIFYEHGWMAVDFFFVLSGFIFFRIYGQSVSERKIGARDFFILRFSRLYPLHLLTLLLVATLQWLSIKTSGKPFIYQLNDTYHFILNVFLAPAWGLQKGFSFNAPVWSVSIELLLYGIFFIVARIFQAKLWPSLFLAFFGFILQGYSELIGRGLFAFYTGGLTFLLFQLLLRSKYIAFWTHGLLVISLSAWTLTLTGLMTRLSGKLLNSLLPGDSLPAKTGSLWIVGLLLPISLLCLAMLEQRSESRRFPGKWLGEISYSSYLIHFPLQLIFFMSAKSLGFDQHIFYNPYVWLAYFATLLGLSIVTHRTFELPMQRVLRDRLLRSKNKR
ncbi:peptidoglycan/LPS O-acetylase OafA/YrhL [Pseudomonas fluvialis]|uniref:Peptidoglycan/LPS O-acetylase OafA/YrhL n=1 Tax=Pseudomonas fluvialis TaxID=1793966 RepID=A0A7X0EQZ0_9PSED|nr:acyltransferase [Pseudomonas fluvialis]MBB6340563.1 peptidoglycan/LPS O-acetylase OafA/YrhL [Pseudomonas fluvialis]